MSNTKQRARQRIPDQLAGMTDRVQRIGGMLEGYPSETADTELKRLYVAVGAVLEAMGTKPAPEHEGTKPVFEQQNQTVHGVTYETLIERLKTEIASNLPKRSIPKMGRSVDNAIQLVAESIIEGYREYAEDKLHNDRDRLKRATVDARSRERNYKRLAKGVQKIITEDEFKLVRSCLHPDKHNGEEKYQKAFEAFNRLADKFA